MPKITIAHGPDKFEEMEVDPADVISITSACICPPRSIIKLDQGKDAVEHIVAGTPSQVAADLGIDEGN